MLVCKDLTKFYLWLEILLDLNNKIKAHLGSTENMFFFLCNAVAKCSNILAFFGVSENIFNQLPDVSFAFAEFF